VIGASAMLGGVTRMTISLVVILFELTGALSHVLPIMICVMTSKWVGDALGTDGIYPVWIAMRRYPWLRPIEYHDRGEIGAHLMKPVDSLVVIEDERCTLQELDSLIQEFDYHGFPIVRNQELHGYVTREKLKAAIALPLSHDLASGSSRFCIFTSKPTLYRSATQQFNLSGVLEESVLQLRKEVPQELVVTMFQKLNIRQILFTHAGKLTGMVTKTDIVSLLTAHFPHTAALSSSTER
jgi:chloride channel 3/4/5